MYAYLGPYSTYSFIISTNLNVGLKDKLVQLLWKQTKKIGYDIHDIKAINPFICMHFIHILDDNMKEVVRKEVIKLLDIEIIYILFSTTTG